MDRRNAIKRTALLLGYSVSAFSVSVVMSGCKADSEVIANGLESWTPNIMTKGQGQILAHLAETVLPKTDTPGAIDAGVHSYIDNALRDLGNTEQRAGFKSCIDDFNTRCKTATGKSFLDTNKKERLAFLETYEKAAAQAVKTQTMPLSIWFQIKEQILFAYFTSEAGATQALNFDPIPGAYHPCIPVEEVGKAWAI